MHGSAERVEVVETADGQNQPTIHPLRAEWNKRWEDEHPVEHSVSSPSQFTAAQLQELAQAGLPLSAIRQPEDQSTANRHTSLSQRLHLPTIRFFRRHSPTA